MAASSSRPQRFTTEEVLERLRLRLKPGQEDEESGKEWVPQASKRGVPVDFFMLFFSASLFQLMVDQSNLYADQLLSGITEMSQYTRLKEAKDNITVPEMKAYVRLQIAMGLCCKPEIEDY
ncbi:hypothetical protein ACOMHN_035045 [Nucella lapillus]